MSTVFEYEDDDEIEADVHVMPETASTSRPHVLSPDCWCHPYRDPQQPRVVIHNIPN